MKKLTYVVGIIVVGIVFSFGMGMYTAYSDYQLKKTKLEQDSIPGAVATPAIAQ